MTGQEAPFFNWTVMLVAAISMPARLVVGILETYAECSVVHSQYLLIDDTF